MVQYGGKNFPPSQTIQISLARSLIPRQKLIILDGGLHEIFVSRRESALNASCALEYPWTVVIITTHSTKKFVQHSIVLEKQDVPR